MKIRRQISSENIEIIRQPTDNLSDEVIFQLENLFNNESGLETAYANIGASTGNGLWS